MLAEGRLQVRQVQEELGLFDAYQLVSLVETGTWDQAVDVRMELQLLGPGVQDGDETIDLRAQAFVRGQFFAQGAGGRSKEQFIGLLVAWAKETAAQFVRSSGSVN